MNVKLKLFGHSYPDDVDVMLSHRGVNRTVMSDVGGSYEVNDRTLRLNDEAATFLPGAHALSAGGFRPTNLGGADTFPSPAPVPTQLAPLSGFDGKNPNGPWKLWAMDDEFLETGLFAGGWSITIKARVRS